MRGLSQSVVICPQRFAAMVLSASQMEGVGRPKRKAGTQQCCLQVHRLGHGQRHENPEQLGIGALQDRIATFDRRHETFALNQR